MKKITCLAFSIFLLLTACSSDAENTTPSATPSTATTMTTALGNSDQVTTTYEEPDQTTAETADTTRQAITTVTMQPKKDLVTQAETTEITNESSATLKCPVDGKVIFRESGLYLHPIRERKLFLSFLVLTDSGVPVIAPIGGEITFTGRSQQFTIKNEKYTLRGSQVSISDNSPRVIEAGDTVGQTVEHTGTSKAEASFALSLEDSAGKDVKILPLLEDSCSPNVTEIIRPPD